MLKNCYASMGLVRWYVVLHWLQKKKKKKTKQKSAIER
uniref:Bm69 n=1 Tax=Brugia malayi TaxID=6279 RepID=A0A1I9FZR5_BRUMA|nr:Bm69 [Brugia malayi]